MAALEARTERLEARMTRFDARLADVADVRLAGAADARPAGAADARPADAAHARVQPRPWTQVKSQLMTAGHAHREPASPPCAEPARREPASPPCPEQARREPASPPRAAQARRGAGSPPRAEHAPRESAGSARLVAPSPRVEDLVGGRVLGWVGGVAILVGVLFFLVVAASRGWLGEDVRVLLASAASLALLAAGAWLHERPGRTDAALAAAATGIAGLFATTVVAGPVYDLLPSSTALAVALLVGATATALALRWEAPGIGWLGIGGALLSPALVGAGGDGAGIALMLVAYVAAGALMIWQRWHALAAVAFAIAVPQLAWWMIGAEAPPAFAAIAALVVFGAATAAGAAGFEWRMRAAQVRISALVLLALNALALAVLGSLGLDETGTSLWLATLAIVHVAAGLLARRSPRLSRELALMLAGLGIVLADVAFASVTDGLPLVLGWTAGAVGFAALARTARHGIDEAVALTGLGGHLLLAVATVMTGAAQSVPEDAATVTVALAAVAAGAWAAARIVAPRRPTWRLALDAAALCALALVSAHALEGLGLTLAFAGEAAALAGLAIRDRARARAVEEDAAGDAAAGDAETAGDAATVGDRDHARATEKDAAGDAAAVGDRDDARAVDPLPFPAAVSFLALALAHTVAAIAPPSVLVAGLDPVLASTAALAAVAIAATLVARAATGARSRLALGALAATVGLYLVSALVVTPFQPGGDATGLPLEQLDIRQQGQALLSAVWALAGLAGLVAGLVRDSRVVRQAALALLMLAVGKVFVFDLASLTSLYRVGSCVVLGLLLLIGAFAWQRIRPRPLPDLRDIPAALR